MRCFTLKIDEVVVHTEAGRVQLEKASCNVREAFRLLAERLDRSPFAQFGEARQYALQQLEIGTVPLDELLSPRGVERLADELYSQLIRRTHGG